MATLNRRTFLRGAAATGAVAASGLPMFERALGQAPKKPNIIFILADDLGYNDLGCYGQWKFQTPRLDRMAREGARFTDFYSGSTVCAPSRCALITGLHTGHCRIRGNAGGQSLQPEDPGLAKMLRREGYATACIGKWGLGDPGSPGVPSKQGFDFFYGYLTHGHAHNYYPTYLYRSENGGEETRVLLRNANPNEQPDGRGQAVEKLDYTPDLFAREAKRWVEAQRDKPFFLFYAPTIPHGNNEARGAEMEVPDLGEYADKPWPEAEKRKAAMIARLDSQVGALLDTLREQGLDDNTLVIFSSDNGPHREGADPEFLDSNGALRGIKRDLFEGGIRVPLVARWPGQIAAGATPNLPAYFPDVLPTLAQIVGTKLDAPTDGLSFLPTLRGQKLQPRHDYLYWEFYEKGGTRAVRLENWKAVRVPFDGPLQLFDLSADASETRDVSAMQPTIVRRMEEIMKAAHVPTTRYNAEAAKAGTVGTAKSSAKQAT